MSATAEALRTARAAAVGLARILRRGILGAVQASGKCQVEAGTGENYDQAEHWQEFGFSSRPPAGTEALVAQAEGDSDDPIVVATNNRTHRPTDMAAGDAVLYSSAATASQPQVRMQADGIIKLLVPDAAGEVHVVGDAEPLVLGDQIGADLWAFASSLALAVTVANVATAATALKAAMGSNGSNWKSAKGKVS